MLPQPVMKILSDPLAFDLARLPEEPRIVICQYGGPSKPMSKRVERRSYPGVDHLLAAQTAVQDGRFKYLVSADGREELYDLVADPGEVDNIIDTHAAEAERLAAALASWTESVPLYEPSEAEAAPELDPAVLEALRSLGYVGGEQSED